MHALECLYAGVKQSMTGVETIVELREPAGEHLERLVDRGVLVDVTPVLVRGGERPRILMIPRRHTGMPTVTEVLGVDHARFDGLLDRVASQAKASDPAIAASAFQFAWSMRRHMAIEDQIVFPLFERSLGRSLLLSDHMRPFRVEHACIEHYTSLLLRSAERVARREPDALAHLLHVHCGLVGVLEEHDRREESSLFPTVDHTASFVKRPDILRRVVAFDPDMTSVMAGVTAHR